METHDGLLYTPKQSESALTLSWRSIKEREVGCGRKGVELAVVGGEPSSSWRKAGCVTTPKCWA